MMRESLIGWDNGGGEVARGSDAALVLNSGGEVSDAAVYGAGT